MYFVGYSKWLLLGSRLVAGEARVQARARTRTRVSPAQSAPLSQPQVWEWEPARPSLGS